jgi:hypothetical protein
MRPLIGFVLLHVLFLGTGWAVLRALALVPAARDPLAVLAALGPALLVGICGVVPVELVLLVLGVPLTPVIALLVAVICVTAARVAESRRTRQGSPSDPVLQRPRPSPTRTQCAGIAAAAVYFLVGGWALAGLPTVLDDARIWSLKGLTLTYHHTLVADIFETQGQAGGHPVYPLLQPALEALLFQSMGSAQLRFMHTELWLVFGSALWMAGYLLLRQHPVTTRRPLWLISPVLLALTPAIITNLAMGDADVTGSVLLAVGTLALGLYLESNDGRFVALAAVVLAAAASTKDEELLAAVLILLAAATVDLVRRRRSTRDGLRRWILTWGPAAVYAAVLILPWRLWTRAHHLTDSVEPPLPRALKPSYLLGRSHELNQTAAAMLHQALSEFGWLPAIFIVACGAALMTRRARTTACFYLTATILSVLALLWLYTATDVPLSFLIPTSMNRTVDVFMLPCALATGHLIAQLTNAVARHDRNASTLAPERASP